MGLKEILQASPQLTILALQEFQREYDGRFVADEFTGFDKVRHTYAHMGISMSNFIKTCKLIRNKSPIILSLKFLKSQDS